jgi:hypothetical protein
LATHKHLKSPNNIFPGAPKTTVVKTYPVPSIALSGFDSSDYVFAPDEAKEGRQDA